MKIDFVHICAARSYADFPSAITCDQPGPCASDGVCGDVSSHPILFVVRIIIHCAKTIPNGTVLRRFYPS